MIRESVYKHNKFFAFLPQINRLENCKQSQRNFFRKRKKGKTCYNLYVELKNLREILEMELRTYTRHFPIEYYVINFYRYLYANKSMQ